MSATLTSARAETARRLSPPEAEALWRTWRERGDGSSRERLTLSYAPMVRYIASRKLRELPGHCELDDLASAGLVALMEAVEVGRMLGVSESRVSQILAGIRRELREHLATYDADPLTA